MPLPPEIAQRKQSWDRESLRKRIEAAELIVQACRSQDCHAVASAVEAANSYCSRFTSQQRLPEMLGLIGKSAPFVFWPVFIRNWSMCDDTWPYRKRALASLRKFQRLEYGTNYLLAQAKLTYEAYPKLVPVFRGCSADRMHEIAWTTDKDMAFGFARGHRSTPLAKPVVVYGLAPKSSIFFIELDRNESEVVVDSARIEIVSIVPLA